MWLVIKYKKKRETELIEDLKKRLFLKLNFTYLELNIKSKIKTHQKRSKKTY